MNKQSRGLGWILGMAASTIVVGPVACGDGFSSEDCRANRTCVGAAGTQSSDGGAGGNGQTADGGADDAAGGADPISNGGAGAGCNDDADCSNDEPSDGEEVCEEGVCAAGNAPPTVVTVTPNDEAVDVALDSQVVIEFSEPLDPDTVTSETIQILDGTTEVAGELAYADGKVTFTPDAELALVGPYTISVTTGVMDVDGAPLLGAFTAQFSTRDGAWKTVDAINDQLFATAGGASITAEGNVLLAWSGSAGAQCPVTARWFAKGAAVAPAAILSPDTQTKCNSVSASANAAGVASVVWRDTTDKYRIYNEQYREGMWSDNSEPVYSSAVSPRFSALVAPDGTAMFLHTENAITRAWVSNAAGAWPAQGVAISSYDTLPTRSVAFDGAGNALAAWPAEDLATQFQRIVTTRFTSATGKWAAGADLPGSVTDTVLVKQDRGAPALAIDSDGDAMMLWVNASSGSKLMASRFSRATGWSDPESISGDLDVKPLFEAPGLVFDGHDFVAAWTADDAGKLYTFTARFDLNAGWSPYEKQQMTALDGTSFLRMPRLASDGRGNLLLVWSKGAASPYTLVYERYTGGAWGPITAIPGGTVISQTFDGDPLALSMNANGLAALSWGNSNNAGFLATIRLASFF